jgi:hypothetical protein
MRIITGKRRYRQVQQAVVCAAGREPREGSGWYIYAQLAEALLPIPDSPIPVKDVTVWRAGRGAHLPDGGFLLPRELLPVTAAEAQDAADHLQAAARAAAEQLELESRFGDTPWQPAGETMTPYQAVELEPVVYTSEELEAEARAIRGDANALPFLWSSPWHLTLDRSEQVARQVIRLAPDVAQCSVLKEHGRWTYRTGSGGRTRVWGACDSPEEAEFMARGILMREWLAYLDEMTARCGGRTDWVGGIPAPEMDCEILEREGGREYDPATDED